MNFFFFASSYFSNSMRSSFSSPFVWKGVGIRIRCKNGVLILRLPSIQFVRIFFFPFDACLLFSCTLLFLPWLPSKESVMWRWFFAPLLLWFRIEGRFLLEDEGNMTCCSLDIATAWKPLTGLFFNGNLLPLVVEREKNSSFSFMTTKRNVVLSQDLRDKRRPKWETSSLFFLEIQQDFKWGTSLSSSPGFGNRVSNRMRRKEKKEARDDNRLLWDEIYKTEGHADQNTNYVKREKAMNPIQWEEGSRNLDVIIILFFESRFFFMHLPPFTSKRIRLWLLSKNGSILSVHPFSCFWKRRLSFPLLDKLNLLFDVKLRNCFDAVIHGMSEEM